MTDTMISSVLSMKCFSVNDLRLIAEKMQLSSYQHDVTSFKKSYRSLGKAIFNDCHVSFGMVEGLHRMYTVKNVLEGRLLRAAEEPVPTNLFLKKKVMVHLHILDTLSKEDLSGFSKLSLLYMKVKNASVERTLYDELINIINDVQQTKESIVDLTKNAEMFCQLGRYDKEEHHILFKQRLFIYTYIARFAFNDKKSTVLYKFQHQHVEQAVGRQHIKDKHQYLNLPLETNLSDKNLFQYVSEVSLSNLIIKAQEFTTISTKATSRNNDWTMKPICQQLRVILSYYVLASVSLESMEESTRIFSPNYKFTHEQVQRNVDILSTMFKIVDTIDDVVTIYRKKTGISATLIYATKIEQMLQMNLFQDVLDVIKKVGHNPKMPVDIIIDLSINNEKDEAQDSVLIELLEGWKLKITTYLNSENEDILTKYKDDLFTVCKGPADKKLTNTNVKHGMFGTETFSAYTVDKKVLFSYFFEQVNNSTLSVYNVTAPTNPTSSLTTTWNDIAASYVVDEAADDGWDDEEEVDHGTEHRSDHNKPKSTSKAAVDETGSVPIAPIFTSPGGSRSKKKDVSQGRELNSSSTKTTSRKKAKLDKKMMEVPEAVLTIYTGAIWKEDARIPVDRDMDMIRDAWWHTIETLRSPADLKNLWNVHRELLIQREMVSARSSNTIGGNNTPVRRTDRISNTESDDVSVPE